MWGCSKTSVFGTASYPGENCGCIIFYTARIEHFSPETCSQIKEVLEQAHV
jgi:hypothetical protein